jgi:hypothetical protein
MEKLMLTHQPGLRISLALSLILFAGSSVAQQASPAPAEPSGIQCGGQYECIEDRPMTPAEAQASRNHPQNGEPQDPKQVATNQSTAARPSGNESRQETSAP